MMIKNVLIICSNTEVIEPIASAMPEGVKVQVATDLPAALATHKSQFDLIFIDVALTSDEFSNEFTHVSRKFSDFNPMVQFVTLTPRGSVRRAVEFVNQGANNYLTYPVDDTEIQLILTIVQENTAKNLELEYLRNQFWKPDWLEIIQTGSPVMREIFESIHSVAPTIANVLLLGETGTGKGLMARLIHQHSHRCDGPFVAVHCGAIPDTLLESELFGHEKGAFTGAVRRKFGKFELAQEGTIFLDEIGTISAAAQIKLLQVLQDGTYSRVGGSEQLHTNARIIAATNADLENMVVSGQFRKDLFYRLNIFPIEMPPLKERIEDLPRLVNLFLVKLNAKYQKKIKGVVPGIMECMQAYDWPGNLRELENVLERGIILETGNLLKPERFPPMLVNCLKTGASLASEIELPLAESRQKVIQAFERVYLTNLLIKHKGKVNVSAQEAGVSTRQLSRLVAKYDLDVKAFKR